MIRNRFAVLLGGAALALLALTTATNAADVVVVPDGCCSTSCCPAPSCKNEPVPDTLKVDHRCPTKARCEEISFPKSSLCRSLFHGWHHKWSCQDGKCGDCGSCEGVCEKPLPSAKCDHGWQHKTEVVKIRKEEVPINKCELCSHESGCVSGCVVGESLPPMPPAGVVVPAKPEPVPAPKPGDPVK